MDSIRIIEHETISGESERKSFERGLRAGFVDDSAQIDARYRPQFIANDKSTGIDLLSVIKKQLSVCDRFDFCVAFVAESGLQPLVEVLHELDEKGIHGRFLTSTYLSFNSPDAYRKLLEYKNIGVRVHQGHLHAKGYLFDKNDMGTVIVGSSNLTQTALTCNREWNVLFRSFKQGGMLRAVKEEFKSLWEDDLTVDLTDEWIREYEESWVTPQRLGTNTSTTMISPKISQLNTRRIEPNDMQKHALEALRVLHDRDEPRALLVSATGTGKTYLSAFDVVACKPRKVLFLAHRQRILEASKQSFEQILGSSYSLCIYSPGARTMQPGCLFAMCSTLVHHLDEFDPKEFDYIVIDEAHRTGSAGYQRIMDYFTPRFYLGMTATPTRTDGYDVFSLFNHVIAFQISLQDALANNMLAPFHYFGIADLRINDEDIEDSSLFAKLTSDERVKHIISKIEEYTVKKSKRRGLVFCNRNDEASELAIKFNEYGYRTCALSGSDNDDKRNEAIDRLEKGELEYIFSVDIFNEGVDIPSLNQIIMLRRTESAIVFVQQLGRGLRKAEHKEYTLVLDFIGNYQENFFIPIALSGDRTFNKDNLRAIVKEGGSAIPGCSTVSFDRIAEARIYEAIDGGNFSAAKLLCGEYQGLRQMLGRIPSLEDFDTNGSIDPLRIFAKFGSYHAFLARYEKDYDVVFTQIQEDMLSFISKKLASGKRSEDLLMLKHLIAGEPLDGMLYKGGHHKREALPNAVAAAGSLLSGAFSAPARFVPLVSKVKNGYELTEKFSAALCDDEFRRQVTEVLDFGIARNKLFYEHSYGDTSLVLNAKYTYEEVCYLLNWEKNVNGQNIGGYKYDAKTNTFPVFINYEKDPDISDTVRYEDRFVSEKELVAISKQPRYLNSPEIERLRAWPANGMRPYLFVRKNKNDGDRGKEFYFLGEIHPTGQFTEITMPGTTKKAVEIVYELRDSVRSDLYEYLTSNIDVLEETR